MLDPLGGLSCPKAFPLFELPPPVLHTLLLSFPPSFLSRSIRLPGLPSIQLPRSLLSYLTFPLAPLYSYVVFTLALAQHPNPYRSLGALHPHPRQTPTPEQVHVCLGLCVLQLRSKPGASHSGRPMFFFCIKAPLLSNYISYTSP